MIAAKDADHSAKREGGARQSVKSFGRQAIRIVENLWTAGAFPVQSPTRRFFFAARIRKLRESVLCARFRPALRLIAARRCVQFTPLPTQRRNRRHT